MVILKMAHSQGKVRICSCIGTDLIINQPLNFLHLLRHFLRPKKRHITIIDHPKQQIHLRLQQLLPREVDLIRLLYLLNILEQHFCIPVFLQLNVHAVVLLQDESH